MSITRGSRALLAVVALSVSFPVFAETVTGRVTAISDGDTLGILHAPMSLKTVPTALISSPLANPQAVTKSASAAEEWVKFFMGDSL